MEKEVKQFCLTSGLAKESKAQQISTLLYCLGEDSKDVFGSMNITKEEKEILYGTKF